MDKPENKSSGKGLVTKLIMGFITIILIVLMFPKGESIEFEVSEGSIWLYDDMIAPFSFPIKRGEEAYRVEVDAAKRSVSFPAPNSSCATPDFPSVISP